MSENKPLTQVLLLLPILILLISVLGWPFLNMIGLSFTDGKLISKTPSQFVFFQNYARAFHNKDYWAALGVSARFAFFIVSFEILLGLGVGLLLNRSFFGRSFVRTLLIVPWALPTIVNAIMWRLIFNPEYGAMNSFLFQTGFIPEYISWLGNPRHVLFSIIFADLWKNFSLVALIVLAALQTVSKDQIEASLMDGADAFRRFWSVILPHILPSLQVAIVLRAIEAVKVFDIIYIMTRGGPANLTRSASIFIYQTAFSFSRVGQGATYSFIMVLFVASLIILYIQLQKKNR